MHPKQDTTVPRASSERFVAVLQRIGVQNVELIDLPVGHAEQVLGLMGFWGKDIMMAFVDKLYRRINLDSANTGGRAVVEGSSSKL